MTISEAEEKLKDYYYEGFGGEGISNFDHVVPDGLEDKMKSRKLVIDYSAWNFNGTVYYWPETKKFYCEVMQYHSHVDTIEADSLEEIMRSASEKYGED